MQIDLWILAFSALTVIATVWMGFWSANRSKTAGDFFVAGRSVSVGWNASAISGEYLSAASFMGVAGMVMSSGYDALWYPVCYACGYLFLLLFIAGPLRRFGAYTIPDFAEGRFDSPVFRKIAVVFVLFIGFFYTMPQMKGAGTTLAYIFPGLPYWVGVVLVGAVITLNVALGGMKGITLVQAFQYWAKMFAISVPVFVLMAVYGHYGKQVGFNHPFAPQGFSFNPSSNAPAATAFQKNPNESILISLAAQEVASNTLSFPGGITIRVGGGFEVAGLVECDGKTQAFKLGTNASTITDGLRRVAPAFRDLVDGFGWIAPEKRGTAVPVQFSADHLFERVEFPARRGLKAVGDSIKTVLVKIGRSRPRASLSPGPTVQMRTLLDACLQNRFQNNRVILYFAAELYEKTVSAPTNRVLTLESLRDFFVTNGVAVVWAAEDVVKIFPTASSAVFMPVPVPEAASSVARVPLPAKAPSDDAWLNPFGPLTTKAAKAAATTRIISDFELISGDEGISSKITALSLRIGEEPSLPWRTMFPSSSSNVTAYMNAVLLVYAKAIGKAVRWQTNMAIQPFPTEVLLTPGTTDAQIAARIEAVMRSSGVTVVMAPHDVVIAVKLADLEKLRAESGTKPAAIKQASVRPYALLYTYSLIIALVCGTAGLPHILVRFYTNPDGVAAKRTTMWVMILIGVFYVFPPVFGVMGRNLLPELYAGVGAKGTDKVVLELPRILNSHSPAHPLTGSLPGAVSGSAGEPVSGKKRFPWGSLLSGVTCAGAFAAFMSTFSGLLVSMTGALAHDVYGRMLRPQATPEQRMRMFKWCAVIVGGVAVLLGMQVEPLQINFMVGQAFAIAAASYFPLLFVSVWWRKLTMKGAATGMLTGGTLALAGISLTSFTDLKWLPIEAFWATHPLLRILCEQPAIWAVPLAITLMIVVSKLTSKDIPSDIRMKMLVLHAPEKLGLKQEYIQEQQGH